MSRVKDKLNQAADQFVDYVSYPEGSPSVNVPGSLRGRYADMAANNPFLAEYNKRTFWDKFANFFGARSYYDKAEAERILSANEYNAQLLQLQNEQDYNSAQEQASRLRQAGINPDLNPGQISAGEAGAFDMPQREPETAQPSDPMKFLYSALQTVTLGVDLFEGGLGILNADSGLVEAATSRGQKDVLQAMTGLPITKIDNDNHKVYLDPAELDDDERAAYGALAQGLGISLDELLKDRGVGVHEIEQVVVKGKIKGPYRNRRMNRIYQSSRSRYLRSPEGQAEIWRLLSEGRQSKFNYDTNPGRPYTDAGAEPIKPETKHAFRKLAKATLDAMTMNLQAAEKQSKYTYDYYNKRDGEKAAENDNQNVELQETQRDVQTKLAEAQKEFVDSLTDDPNYMDKAIIFMMSMMSPGSSLGMPSLPSIDFKSGMGKNGLGKAFHIGF